MGGVDEKWAVEITTQGAFVIVRFKSTNVSDVDAITGAAMQIKDFINEKQPGRLIFDFDGVKFFSSQVLGLLLDVRSRLKTYGAGMAVSGINPQLHRVFKITNLDKLFTFYPDLQAALNAAVPDKPA